MTYALPDGGYVTRANETQPLCTSEFSDISPLTGGTVVFSTLEGRPGAYDFENNLPLQVSTFVQTLHSNNQCTIFGLKIRRPTRFIFLPA